MVQAWYMDDLENDPQEEHHLDPPECLTADELYQVSGVEYWSIDVDDIENDGKLKKIRQERGYNYEDMLDISRDKLPSYEENLKMFYKEHLHPDEEIRLFLDGNGYFDARDKNNRWIRIKVGKGDLLILPAGIYHRFTLDKSNCCKIMRLFSSETVWTAVNRPADDHPSRKQYLNRMEKELSSKPQSISCQ